MIYAFYVIINFLIDNNYNNAFVNTYKLIFVNGDLFKGPLLITLGLFIRKYKINISWLKALLLVIGSFAISILLPNEITKLIFFVSNFLLAMQLNNIKINTIYFRKSSTIFYFMHLLNAFIVGLILGIKEFSGVYTFLIVCLMCTIESIIILFIQNKWNFKFINELFNWSSGKKVSKESSC